MGVNEKNARCQTVSVPYGTDFTVFGTEFQKIVSNNS